jgi:hypothetical protein
MTITDDLASEPSYRLGHEYRDTGSSSDPEDQFLAWINIPGSGIRNRGGVRPLKFANTSLPVHAYIILVTDERSALSASNPWEDLVDVRGGRIMYWGDAKFGEKRVDEFVGNRSLRAAWEQVLENNRELVPPILHFSKIRTGWLKFNGLCVIDALELTWFEDEEGRPVKNYRAHLTILDQEEVSLNWLHRRATLSSTDGLSTGSPNVWRRYLAGFADPLRVWAPRVRSQDAQLPLPGSNDAAVLDQLAAMDPTRFEAAVVSLFRELDIRHEITRTRQTRDGGFDFFGSFLLPPPLDYEISFLGEAKKFGTGHAVDPRHVSRLVARLGRGQYGLFVTTSFYTRQAQEEVYADGYPTRLISGGELVRMMRELRIARGSAISRSWLHAVEEEMATNPRRERT